MKVKEISIADIIPYENNQRKNDVAVDPERYHKRVAV